MAQQISASGNWSAGVTRESSTLELEAGVFTWQDPRKIAQSLKRSADTSARRYQFLKLEELRELPDFGTSRRRSVPRCPCWCFISTVRAKTSTKTRSVFWSRPRMNCVRFTAKAETLFICHALYWGDSV